MRKERIKITKIRGVKLFLFHKEFFIFSILIILASSSNFAEKAGQYSAYLVLVVIHELGHALLGAMRGWRTKALTFGVLSGLCEFRQDGPEVDAATHLKSDIIVSWGGAVAELLILLATISIFSKGLWPEGSFFQGVFTAFTLFATASIFLNLLPIKGYDGEFAWKWIWWKKNLEEYE